MGQASLPTRATSCVISGFGLSVTCQIPTMTHANYKKIVAPAPTWSAAFCMAQKKINMRGKGLVPFDVCPNIKTSSCCPTQYVINMYPCCRMHFIFQVYKRVKRRNHLYIASSLWLQCSNVVRNVTFVCLCDRSRIRALFF